MHLNDVISIIGTLVTIAVPVVGVLVYFLTKKPDKKVVFIVSTVTTVVIVCILAIAIAISGATGGNSSSAAQQTGSASTQSTSPTNLVNTITPVTQPPLTPPPTTGRVSQDDAASVMKSFCDDINSGYIEGAYALTSSAYQAQESITNFRNQFNYPDISKGGCLYGTPQVSGDTATVTLTFDKL